MAEATPSVLDEAWARIPQTRGTTAGIGTFTRTRVERIISAVAGLGSLVLGAQAFVAAAASSVEGAAWHIPLMALAFVPLAVMILACLIGRGVRLTGGLFAFAYLLALLAWPLATADTPADPMAQPWLWYLVNIATLAGVLAFPLLVQIVWTALVPLLFGVVRLIQAGFVPDAWFAVGLDVSFALILGGLLLVLGWVFRSVAAGVDEARARAVESYADAAAADAAEQERVAVAALMHDSVLAALIAAERAESPRQRTLAAAMAREALTRLANTEQGVEEGSDAPVPAASVAAELERAARELGADLTVTRGALLDDAEIPGRVARALALAGTQAVANVLEHAEGRGLVVAVRAGADPLRLAIAVSDSGDGFDLADIPDDRLGIRASIIARVAAVGGTTRITSDDDGTRVELEWIGPSS